MFRRLFRSAARQLHVLSTQTIKPASPTPSCFNRYNLSSMDQFSPHTYIPIVFYYPNHAPNNAQDIADKSCRLKHSLSEILIQFYPFAGRLHSGAYIDCNDEGVEFQEVNIKCGLSEILDKSADEALGLVFPAGLIWGNLNYSSSPLVIRLTTFECGGIAIAVCLSHKLGDGCSFSTFMTSWATKMRTNTSSEDKLLSPHFISHPSNDDAAVIVPEYPVMKKDGVKKRFVFPNSKIAQLKAIVNESGLQNTTRVEVITALLYKCAMAVTTANSGLFSPSALVHPVNMRLKILPPVPETSIGNIYWSIFIPTRNESEINLNALVEKIQKGKMEIGAVKTLDATKYWSNLLEFSRNNYSFFFCSSLCRMPFYQIDFGWGCPSKVILVDAPINNSFILMDTPNGDGIEAMVSLDEENMATFEQDKEILAFTSLHSTAGPL
ncbi:hypothetical protein LguiA_025743 [Lonicera macranthoides]